MSAHVTMRVRHLQTAVAALHGSAEDAVSEGAEPAVVYRLMDEAIAAVWRVGSQLDKLPREGN